MNREKLNMLVVAYQNGDEFALDDIFREVNPIIEKASRELEAYVTEFTKFDCRVVMKLKKLATTFCIGKHDFLSAAKAIIANEKADFFKRRRDIDGVFSKEALESPEDAEAIGKQFADPLAGVEDEVLLKEKIALLAQGDQEKELIVHQWIAGASDSSISKLLAQRFGGNAESKRRAISRFKVESRSKLSVDLF